MMSNFVYYLFVLLCYSITKSEADSVRYYFDYECNEPLLASAKLSATSSLRDRGPDNAKLHVFDKWSFDIYKKTKKKEDSQVTGCIPLQVHNIKNLNFWTSRNIHSKMESSNVRWAFNAKTWEPNKDEIVAVSSFIQPEEKERISRYVFKDDAKTSLIGRLMMRKFVHLYSSMPYEEIRFGRDDRGKPYLLGVGDSFINFNVSHQGDFVVLAGSTRNVGIDVMKIEPPANKNIPEFFRIMNKQFSNTEWGTILGYHTEMEQIACFYRLWCLKESYVKNIGLGITIPLQEISFSIKTLKLEVGKMVTDTTLFVKEVMKDDWVFEESLLDEKHAVAVSLLADRNNYKPVLYKHLTFNELVKEGKPLFESDHSFGEDFLKKQIKNF